MAKFDLTRNKNVDAVFVELGDVTKSADIVRRGFKVPPAKVDRVKVDQAIGDYVVVEPKFLPRVITQSVAAGTKVPPGTTVDLVLAPKDAILFDFFENPHVALRGRSVAQVDGIAANAAARKILLSYDTAEEVPAQERQQLEAVFNQNQVQVDEARTDTSFKAAFNSMRSALAFQE